MSHDEGVRIYLYTLVSLQRGYDFFIQPCHITKGEVQNEPDRNQLKCIGWINRIDWPNQLKWLVESIEMISWINRNDWSNQLNPIEVNPSDWSDDRSQSNQIEDLHFFQALIDFDCSIDQFDCSINHFDWVRSIRPINSIEFDWVWWIHLTIKFDCVWLTCPGGLHNYSK